MTSYVVIATVGEFVGRRGGGPRSVSDADCDASSLLLGKEDKKIIDLHRCVR